jgi:hypothetical protein
VAEPYYTLISALPHLPSLFENRRLPVSRIRLEERLAMLNEEDAAVLADIEHIYHWNKTGISDEVIAVETQAAIARVPHADLRNVIEQRLALRTVVTALRYRQAGHWPEPDTRWGYPPYDRYIERHSNDPYFHLELIMPWLPEIAELLEQGRSWDLEKRLLAIEWESHAREATKHYFNFEAVALYVQRWHLIDRWIGYAHTDAPGVFNGLVEQALTRGGSFWQKL